MTQSQKTAVANPLRQAAYRRLALTILALDVPTLTVRLQASHIEPSTVVAQPQRVRAA